MSAFDKVIGYQPIKDELLEICDMIKNPEVYKKLGARLPKGILFSGDPGLGKTLMARCFIEESGLNVYTLRRDSGKDSFMEKITETLPRRPAKTRKRSSDIIFRTNRSRKT